MEVTRFHFFLYLSQPRCFFEKLPRLWFIYCSIYDLGSQLLQILQSRLPPKCGAALSLCYENMQLDLRKTLRDQKIKDWPWLLWRFGWCRITTVTTVCSFIPGLSSIRLHFTAKWFTRNSEVKAQHASYPWWGLGYSLLPLFTSWCVSWPLSSTKEVANLQAIFGITKNFPIPKKMGKVTRLTSSQQFSQRRKKGGGGNRFFRKRIFQRNSPWKPTTSCLLCWGFKPGRPWTKPLSLVIRCCKAWRKSCGEAPRRSWSRRIFQSPWGVWSLEEITTHRTHAKVSFGTLKLKEWAKKIPSWTAEEVVVRWFERNLGR